MKKEYLDVVDKNGKVIAKEDREVLHQSPDKIHPVVHIFIINSKNEILIQKRSIKKKFGGGLWEISAGGHIDAGENPDAAARRELKEELGVKTELKFITKRVFSFHNEKELAHLYIGYSDGPFKIDEREIEKVKFVNIKKIPDYFRVDKHGERSMLELWLPIIRKNRDLIFKSS